MNDMPNCFTVKVVKARKTHVCCECDIDIERGEDYERFSGIWPDSGPGRFKTCLKCISIKSQAIKDYNHNWPDEYGPAFGLLYEWIEDCK